ncbi:ADP-ribosyltransferase-containing protein [Geopseudomonas aromaticivorans]
MRRSSGILRDEFGCPRVLYHGTNRQIDRFDACASRRRAAYFGDGIYFTDSAWQASSYAGDGEGANVIPVHLSLANPFIEGVSAFNGGRALVATELRSDLILEAYRKAGHDGVILARGWLIAFSPDQIHFAIGSRPSAPAPVFNPGLQAGTAFANGLR